jgi:Lipoprotein LpqB beta-propeller domain/Sporulation and spore germination
MRNRRWFAVSGAVVLGTAATACAALPTSGSALTTAQRSGGQVQNGVQIVPAPPGAGWSPKEIVNGFLAASANFDGHNHKVARQYLTPGFSRRWRPGWAATIIDAPEFSSPRTPPQPKGSGRPVALVELTGQHFAKLQTAGQDQAGSVVVSPSAHTYQFSLVQAPGGWRIDAIFLDRTPVNPKLLLLTSTDFARDYLPRNLYFYSSRSAADALVPDPVYIPQTGPESEVRGLVNALINPPATSWLWGAATTAFPRGTTLIKSPQIIGGIKAVIQLGGAALRTDRAERKRMYYQLAWSLTAKSSPYATQYPSPINSVELRIGSERLDALPPSSLVPRGAASPLFYQVSEAQAPAVSALLAGSPTPVQLPLPAGLGAQPFTAMAVSTAQNPPIVAGCAGRSLYLVRLAAGVLQGKKVSAAMVPAAVRKQLPAGCTSLSWDARGNLWVTANSRTQSHPFVLSANDPSRLAKASLVPVVPTWLSMPTTTLRVAPDGVRAAMIVGSGGGKRIVVAGISGGASVIYVGQTQQTLRVGSDIANPVALTWLDPDHLLVLSRSGGRTQMFQVPLNGGESTEISIPGGVTSVAASWPNGQVQPRVVIGIAATVSSLGRIEMSKTGWPNPHWLPVVRGTVPVFPG